MIGLEQKRFLFATLRKGIDCIEKSLGNLKEREVEIPDIKQVCIDI